MKEIHPNFLPSKATMEVMPNYAHEMLLRKIGDDIHIVIAAKENGYEVWAEFMVGSGKRIMSKVIFRPFEWFIDDLKQTLWDKWSAEMNGFYHDIMEELFNGYQPPTRSK